MNESSVEAESSQMKKDMPLKRRILLGIGLPLWVLSGFILASLLIGIAGNVLIDMDTLSLGEVNESIFNSAVAALVYALSLLIVIGVPLKLLKSRTTKEELGLTRLPNWTDILLTPVAFIIYTILAAVILAIATGMFSGFDVEQEQEVGFSDLTQAYEYVLAFITLVVVAPIAEEVLIRGYLYGKMRPVTGVVAATIVSSLLFSLMHFQWNVALNVLPLGIVMVVLREMTGSIWAGILLHMLKNGIAYYLLFINPSILDTMVV